MPRISRKYNFLKLKITTLIMNIICRLKLIFCKKKNKTEFNDYQKSIFCYKNYITNFIQIDRFSNYINKLTITKILIRIIFLITEKDKIKLDSNQNYIFPKHQYTNTVGTKLTPEEFADALVTYIIFIPLYFIKKMHKKCKNYIDNSIRIKRIRDYISKSAISKILMRIIFIITGNNLTKLDENQNHVFTENIYINAVGEKLTDDYF